FVDDQLCRRVRRSQYSRPPPISTSAAPPTSGPVTEAPVLASPVSLLPPVLPWAAGGGGGVLLLGDDELLDDGGFVEELLPGGLVLVVVFFLPQANQWLMPAMFWLSLPVIGACKLVRTSPR